MYVVRLVRYWIVGTWLRVILCSSRYGFSGNFLLVCSRIALNEDSSYIIEGGVCYLTLCERSYPKKLAYQYLEELQREFEKVNRSQIETVARPYAFIKFGKFSSSTGLQLSFNSVR